MKSSDKQIKHEIVINQIKKIDNTITKIRTKLFIATSAYDKYYKRYYIITLLLFIFSSIVTFLEALRLSIVEYVNKSDQSLINEKMLSIIINVLVLVLGIVITILSSIVRFKNYREILEELREKQNIMIEHIDKYRKQKNNLEFIYQIKENDITFEEIEKIKNDIAEYDTKIESTNILQYLTTKDIIKYNNYKGNFDFKIKEIILKYKKLFKTLEDKEDINIINSQKDDNEYINIINSQKDDKNKTHIIVQPNQPKQFIQLNQPNQFIQLNQPNQFIQLNRPNLPNQKLNQSNRPILHNQKLNQSNRPILHNQKLYQSNQKINQTLPPTFFNF
jgi:hypothetical protein